MPLSGLGRLAQAPRLNQFCGGIGGRFGRGRGVYPTSGKFDASQPLFFGGRELVWAVN